MAPNSLSSHALKDCGCECPRPLQDPYDRALTASAWEEIIKNLRTGFSCLIRDGADVNTSGKSTDARPVSPPYTSPVAEASQSENPETGALTIVSSADGD
ncbi:hypothetical protein KIL84_008625 [Mauremys mutica]|uniref:Uncharacterized protein n=1 Tax=Mauremys mutica TaxID=74926 RepID=A0A9D3X691_9SAUR|nr:hypothetical protein KIL84_008625 [Mauremys mutica]